MSQRTIAQGGLRTAHDAVIPLKNISVSEAIILLDTPSLIQQFRSKNKTHQEINLNLDKPKSHTFISKIEKDEVTVITPFYLIEHKGIETTSELTYKGKHYDLISTSWKNYYNQYTISKKDLEKELGKSIPNSWINKEFEDGATRFMKKSQYEKYGAAQSDGTSFVIPKKDADQLLSTTNGDRRTIEKRLGFPDGSLNNDRLVRIDIPNPNQFNARVPNGKSEAILDLGNVDPNKLRIKEIKWATYEI